jgi:hypothetical protein
MSSIKTSFHICKDLTVIVDVSCDEEDIPRAEELVQDYIAKYGSKSLEAPVSAKQEARKQAIKRACAIRAAMAKRV